VALASPILSAQPAPSLKASPTGGADKVPSAGFDEALHAASGTPEAGNVHVAGGPGAERSGHETKREDDKNAGRDGKPLPLVALPLPAGLPLSHVKPTHSMGTDTQAPSKSRLEADASASLAHKVAGRRVLTKEDPALLSVQDEKKIARPVGEQDHGARNHLFDLHLAEALPEARRSALYKTQWMLGQQSTSLAATGGVVASLVNSESQQAGLSMIDKELGLPSTLLMKGNGHAFAIPVSLYGANASLQAHLTTPVTHPGFAKAVGEQVSWLIGQGKQSVQMQLNPPQLGPLTVHVQINGDQTQVSFQTHHPSVRYALEGAASQLRDLLGQNGQQTVHVSVNLGQGSMGGQQAQQFQQGSQYHSSPSQHASYWPGEQGAVDAVTDRESFSGWRMDRPGLFDTYV